MEVKKAKIRINLFITQQRCGCDGDTGCCAAPGQSKKEIAELAKALKTAAQADVGVNEIRDIKIMDRFPKAAALFKKYGYNCLPIVMVGSQVTSYGIPDAQFIVNSIKKVKIR